MGDDGALLHLVLTLISCLAAAVSAGCAIWMAKNDAARMKRVGLVLEVSGGSDAAEWTSLHLTIRNLEPVSAVLTGVRTSSRYGRLHPPRRSLGRDVYARMRLAEPEKAELARSISVQRQIGPAGQAESVVGLPAGTIHVSVDAFGPIAPEQIAIDWRWADGTPR